MTAFSKTQSSKLPTRAARLLLVGCSALALCGPAAANEVLFSTGEARPETGQRTTQSAGLTQVVLSDGGTASIVDAADYQLNADGSIDLYRGSVTVAGGDAGETVVRMPQGLEGRVAGRGSAGNFSVGQNGEASGHALNGSVRIGRGREFIRYDQGDMWRASAGGGPRRVVANEAQAQPAAMGEAEPAVIAAIGGDAGPVGAALNGIPVTLGDALAAAGASSDIIAAGRRVEIGVGNPSLDTFPTGDLALLIAAAAELEGSYGGQPFAQAQADIIRSYLRFLANGGSGAEFLTAYSGFVIGYLDLIRAGGVPSGFASGSAGAADIDAYLAFIARTGAISSLAARDRTLADAYLAFIASGGNRDLFAASFTNLTTAYFAFVRAGGIPGDFTGASQDALAQSIAFLQQSGLVGQLSAADQALVAAFLQNGGLAFTAQFQTALDDYFAFLASGRLPSEYGVLDQATLRAYLETLSDTGLLQTVLADRAGFYANYLAFLRAGGNIDAFAGLPANIFAGYATELDAYFAFLAAGNLPSQYTASDIAILQAYIAQLQAAGALDRFLGANAAFFADYAAFVAAGGAFDAFAGLNANIFAGYAVDLAAYYEFLLAGGVPSNYTVLSQETIQQYLAALEAAGATGGFLGDLTDFYRAYFVFLAGGGNPDLFGQLPVPPDFPAFASALNAYALFLANGGLPSDYSAADLAELQAFLDAIIASGQLNALLGANATLLTDYFAFLANGGNIDGFASLPIYLDYVAALNAYFDFLAAGGLPSNYTVLDQATIEAYLAALAALQGGLGGFADLNQFFIDYFIFISGGGDPNLFAGLPGNNGGGGLQFTYAGGFDSDQAFNVYVTTPTAVSRRLDEQGLVDADGRLSTALVTPVTAAATDIGGDRAVVIGRFENGLITQDGNGTIDLPANGGLAYAAAAPFTGTLPTTGTISYEILAATRPVYADGATLPGILDADLVFAFGSQLRYAMAGTISMPDGIYTISAGLIGDGTDGSANYLTANSQMTENLLLRPALSGVGRGCVSGQCELVMAGGFAGASDGNRVGFVYRSFDRRGQTPDSQEIVGAVAFGATGTLNVNGGVVGGGTGSDGVPPGTGTPLILDFADQFTATTGVNYNLSFGAGGLSGFDLPTFEVRSDGALILAADGITTRSIGEAKVTDISGNDRFLIGRWTDGDYSTTNSEDPALTSAQGLHYLLAAPATGSFTVPASGTITYDLIAATAPTIRDGSLAPGQFEAQLALVYGSTVFAAMEGSITMPTSGADYVYSFATEGGLANPSLSTSDLFLRGRRFAFSIPSGGITTSDNNCDANCTISFNGYWAGDDVDQLGLTYTARAETNAKTFAGAAIFGRSDTGGGTGGTGNNFTYSGGFPTNSAGGRVFATNASQALRIPASTGISVDAEGVLQFAGAGANRVAIGSGEARDVAGDEDIVLGRYVGDQVIFNDRRINIPVNAGAAYLVHTGFTGQLPTSGTINYDIYSATSPVFASGSSVPGVFDADLTIAFGSNLRVGINGTIMMPEMSGDVTYSFATADRANGGFVPLSSNSTGELNFSAALLGNGSACSSTMCSIFFLGGFAGDGPGDKVGFVYQTADERNFASADVIQGSVAFRAAGTQGTASGSSGQTAMAIASTLSAMGGADWSRWTGNGGGQSGGQGVMSASPQSVALLPPGVDAPSGREATGQPSDRDGAIRQAERLMGGMITFGQESIAPR